MTSQPRWTSSCRQPPYWKPTEMSNLKAQLTQLLDSAVAVTERLQHNKLSPNDIAALKSSINSVLPIAERHERLLRTVDVSGLTEVTLELEVCAINLWNAVSVAIKGEPPETRKVLCSIKFFACLLCSIHESLTPSLKEKFRTLNCLYRSLRTAVDEEELTVAEKVQEHADRVFKSLESLSTGFDKDVFKEFQKVKAELFITKMQLSIVEGDTQMAKFYEERAEVFGLMIDDNDQSKSLETVRVIYNSCLLLFEKGQFEDVIHFLKKTTLLISQLDSTDQSVLVKRSVYSLLCRACFQVKSQESLELASETIQSMEELSTTQTVEPFQLAIELSKIRGSATDIESIIMRMIMAVPIANNFKSILGIINDYAIMDPPSAIKCYEYAFTNKLDPNEDHEALEMVFVAMVNAQIKDKQTSTEMRQLGLSHFFDSSEKILVKSLSKKCSSSSITLLWSAGKGCTKINEHRDAIEWLKLGLHRVLQINDIDKAKFQRVLQNCYLHLEEYEKVITVYEHMSSEAQDSLITQYNMFKAYSSLNRHDKLMGSLKRIVSYDDKNLIPLLSLCAINCQANTRVAVDSMLHLFKKIQTGLNSDISVASTLKCVIELILKESDSSFKDHYKETLLTLLQEAHSFAESNPKLFSVDELTWFGAQSFNTARDCLLSNDYFYGDLFACCCTKLIALITDDISWSNTLNMRLWSFRAGLISIMCQSKITGVDSDVIWNNVRTRALNLRIMIDELMIITQQNSEYPELKPELEKCLLDCMVFQFRSELELGNQSSMDSIIKESLKLKTVEFDSTLINMVFEAHSSNRLKSHILSEIIERNIPDSKVPSTTISRWVRLLLKQGDIDISTQKILTQIIVRLGSQADENRFPAHEVEWMATQCWNRGVGLFFNGDKSQGKIWCTHAMRLSKFVNERLETSLMKMWDEIITE